MALATSGFTLVAFRPDTYHRRHGVMYIREMFNESGRQLICTAESERERNHLQVQFYMGILISVLQNQSVNLKGNFINQTCAGE